MKKTILVSIGTTLATMFVVMICVHICKSHCGQSKCGKASIQCSSSYGHGGGDYGKCASFAKSCHAKKSCNYSNKKCSKGSATKCCKSKSKCSKGKSCDKSKWKVTTKGGVTTKTYTSDDNGTIVKKVIKVKAEEEV